MQKVCFKCGIMKDINLFYTHKMMADGHVNKCKECNKNDVRANRLKNVDYYRNYDANRPNYNDRIRANVAYTREYREKFPEKYRAHTAVGNALRSGIIVKPSICPKCGDITKSSQMHGHHSDYSKPLEVDWM